MVIAAVRAGLRGRHRVTDAAEEGMIEAHRRDAQFRRVELGKDALGIEGTVVVANASMIASDDEMRAAVILAHQGVEDGFARPRVPHGGGEHSQNHAIRRVVVLKEHFVAAHAYIGGDIVALGLTDQGMQVEAIHRLQGTLLDVFVRAMDGVARLEADDALPAARRTWPATALVYSDSARTPGAAR